MLRYLNREILQELANDSSIWNLDSTGFEIPSSERQPTLREILDTVLEARWTERRGSNFYIQLAAHSMNERGEEMISWKGCYERFIHAEVMTHRWSRNYSSSRAIPYEMMKAMILRDPGLPLHMGSNRSGMQAGPLIQDVEGARAYLKHMLDVVYGMMDDCVERFDLHKEIMNRYSEPWGWITGVMTMGGKQFNNYLNLRCNKMAHPNIQRVAACMARLYQKSTPRALRSGEWHVPWVDDMSDSMPIAKQLVWSAARAAWTSYETVDRKVATFDNAVRRHDDCVTLKHATPLEHQGMALGERGNGVVPGFLEYRMTIPGESCDVFDFDTFNRDYADRDYVPAT